jgi:NitT/TauT family transport system substrate-binding protein
MNATANRRFPTQRLISTLLSTGVVATLAACGGADAGGSGDGNEASGGTQTVSVLLPFSRSIAFWPVHVADELGYLKEEGIDIEDEATDGSSFVVQQVSAGKAPIGIAVTEPALLGYAQNPTFSTVYDFLTGNAFDVWVRDDSDVQELRDLQPGDAIAIKDQAGGEIPALNISLQNAGLNPGTDITYKQFGENAAVAADLILNRKVDALEVSWNSLVGIKVALEEQGINLRCITCSADETLAAESVIVHNDFLEENGELVEGFGRALAKATLFGTTNPDAAIEIMKRINPEEQTDQAYTTTYFTDAVNIMQPRPAEGKYGWQDPEAYQRSMELLVNPDMEQGLAEEINLDEFVSNDLVDAYNDFDHEAVIDDANSWTS